MPAYLDTAFEVALTIGGVADLVANLNKEGHARHVVELTFMVKKWIKDYGEIPSYLQRWQ